jgi:hypothetical protein
VDIGAGTGQFTLQASPRCGRVVAVDVSPAMLNALHSMVQDHGLCNVAVVRPSGVCRLSDVVFSFEPSEAADRIEAWCATDGLDGGDEWTRAELEEHVRDEGSTYTWLLEPMIERCGFHIEEAAYSEDGILAAYVLRAF